MHVLADGSTLGDLDVRAPPVSQYRNTELSGRFFGQRGNEIETDSRGGFIAEVTTFDPLNVCMVVKFR